MPIDPFTGGALLLGGIGQIGSWIQGSRDRREREKQLKRDQARIREMMSGEHPGMGQAEWQQALGGIQAGVRGQEAQLAQMQSRFGGSVDPGAFARARAPAQAGGVAAKASLSAKRAAMDRQFALAIEQALRSGNMDAARLAMQQRQEFTQGMAGLGQMLGGIGAMSQPQAQAGGYMPSIGVTQQQAPFATAGAPSLGGMQTRSLGSGVGNWNPSSMVSSQQQQPWTPPSGPRAMRFF